MAQGRNDLRKRVPASSTNISVQSHQWLGIMTSRMVCYNLDMHVIASKFCSVGSLCRGSCRKCRWANPPPKETIWCFLLLLYVRYKYMRVSQKCSVYRIGFEWSWVNYMVHGVHSFLQNFASCFASWFFPVLSEFSINYCPCNELHCEARTLLCLLLLKHWVALQCALVSFDWKPWSLACLT